MGDYGGKCNTCKVRVSSISRGLCVDCEKKVLATLKKTPVITNDYIKGYVAALKTVGENVDHRIDMLENYSSLFEGCENRKNELISVRSHLNQLSESYKQLVKELNATKN